MTSQDDAALERLLKAIPADVLGLCRRLHERGKRGWVVGGSVRDVLRGAAASDWDIATDAHPKEVQRIFRKVIPTGIKHGTVTVLLGGVGYEVTTLRGEGAYHDGRHPEEVVFLDDIVEDLARRDFTFNAIAVEPHEGHLIDPFGGRADLEAKRVKAVGEPLKRFTEDGLRVLRAARFAAALECVIEPVTLAAMGHTSALDTLRQVSAERVHDEWLKMMRARRPSIAFNLMRDTNVIDVHAPELRDMVGCAQDPPHTRDVWDHTMAVVDGCAPDAATRLAALLHDVAKPQGAQEGPEATASQRVLTMGTALAEKILRRLKFSNEHRKEVCALIQHCRIHYQASWSDAQVRRWLAAVSPGRHSMVLQFAEANWRGKGGDVGDRLAGLAHLGERARRQLEKGLVLTSRDLALGGRELMAELQMPPGRAVGVLLASLLELVIEDPSLNERDALLAEAQRILQKTGAP